MHVQIKNENRKFLDLTEENIFKINEEKSEKHSNISKTKRLTQSVVYEHTKCFSRRT